jgi:DNA mismatch endonuclease (patch repair protein)
MLKLNEKKPVASVLWPESRAETRRILSGTSTPLLQGNYVYSMKLNRQPGLPGGAKPVSGSGKQIRSRARRRAGAPAMHMTVNGGSVFIYNELGELILAHLSSQGYEEICRTNSGGADLWFWRQKIDVGRSLLCQWPCLCAKRKGNHLRFVERGLTHGKLLFDEWWVAKLEGNAARDKLHQHALRKFGWRTIVVWECRTEDPKKLEQVATETGGGFVHLCVESAT